MGPRSYGERYRWMMRSLAENAVVVSLVVDQRTRRRSWRPSLSMMQATLVT